MNINHDFSKLTLISSAGCNLSCKYCAISQNKTSLEYSNQMQKEIIQAFKDGSFLDNTKKIYSFFNQDFSIVKEINLWGQEPTLTLPYLTDHLEDWIKTYFNCQQIFFSTNMGNNPIILFNFMQKLDNIISKPLTLKIQMSYDGEWSCKNERGIDSNFIKKNYLLLINKINETVFKKLTIHLSTHGVISFDMVNSLINCDQLLLDYIQDLDNIQYFIQSNIQNNSCKYLGNSLIIEQPHKTSSEDAKKLTIFLEKINILSNNLLLRFPNPSDNLLQQLSNRITYNSNWLLYLNNQLNISYNPFININNKIIYKNLTCGIYKSELKITYNGILLDCLNNIFNTNEEFLNTKNIVDYSVFKSSIQNHYYINPIEDKEEDIEKIFDIYDNIPKSFLSLYQSVINLIILLVDNNQADITYKYNKDKLIRHAYYISRFQYCTYNKLLQSGSHYLGDMGVCRLFCNGLLDLIDKYNLKKGIKDGTI